MKRSELVEARRTMAEGFKEQLSNMGVKGKKLSDLCAGFDDGFSNAIWWLRDKGILTLED